MALLVAILWLGWERALQLRACLACRLTAPLLTATWTAHQSPLPLMPPRPMRRRACLAATTATATRSCTTLRCPRGGSPARWALGYEGTWLGWLRGGLGRPGWAYTRTAVAAGSRCPMLTVCRQCEPRMEWLLSCLLATSWAARPCLLSTHPPAALPPCPRFPTRRRWPWCSASCTTGVSLTARPRATASSSSLASSTWRSGRRRGRCPVSAAPASCAVAVCLWASQGCWELGLACAGRQIARWQRAPAPRPPPPPAFSPHTQWPPASPLLPGYEHRLLMNYNDKPLLTRPQQRFYTGGCLWGQRVAGGLRSGGRGGERSVGEAVGLGGAAATRHQPAAVPGPFRARSRPFVR